MSNSGKKIVVVSFLAVLAFYSFLSFLSTDVGVIGDRIKVGLVFTFGIGAYAFPFLVAYLAYEIAVFNQSRRYRFISRIIGISLWLLVFLALVERRAVKSPASFLDHSLSGQVGRSFYLLFSRYLGNEGTLLFLLVFAFLGTYLLGEGKLVRQIVHVVKSVGRKLRPPRESKPQKEAHLPDRVPKTSVSPKGTPLPTIEEVFEVATLGPKMVDTPKKSRRNSPLETTETWTLPPSKILSSPPSKGEEKSRKEIAEEIRH
jgi:hypothetical protein